MQGNGVSQSDPHGENGAEQSASEGTL